MSTIVGVDLGTTWTAAAVLNGDTDGRPEPVMLTTRSMAMPSAVALPADSDGATEEPRLIGGEEAAQLLAVDPTVGAREFKRRLGDETPYIVAGTPLGAEALMAGLLRATLDHPAVESAAGGRPERVVLTHPANWGQYKLDLVAEIARLAGLDPDRVDLMAEPSAAAIAYAADGHLAVGDIAAVYDFGGGTFDAAVVKLEPSGPVIVGEPEGLERLGGIDLDQAVLHHVDQALDGALAAADATDVEVRNALFRVRLECTRAKEALSDATEVSIPVALPGLSTEVRLTRSEFEAAIAPRLDDTFAALDRAVASTGTTMDELAGTLLVGGSSRLPLVAERLAAHTGRPVLMDADPKLAVAIGAAGRARYAELTAAAAIEAVGERADRSSDEHADRADDGSDGTAGGAADRTAELPSPAALGASITVDRPERPDPTEARKAKKKQTARKVAGGVAAAGAAAGAATVAAAAVANAGPLAGLGPLEGDFDLGDAVDEVADAAKAAFGFPTGDADNDGDEPDDSAQTAEDARFDTLRDLLGADDELDEFGQDPTGAVPGASPFGTPGAAGPSAFAFGAGGGGGGAAGGGGPAGPVFRPAAAPAAAAPPRPVHRPEPAQARPEPAASSPPHQPSAPAQPPTTSTAPDRSPGQATAGGLDPELEAVRAQLRDRLEGWEQPDGVDPEDAARLQRDLDGLLDRFQRTPGTDLDDAIADLKYQFEDRMRDFAQDQKLDALIDEEERETREQQELDDGVEAARTTLREKLSGWSPPPGADPAEAEALRAELAELLERYTPTPGQSVDDAIAELRDGFNDRVGDFAQDLRIDALIESVEESDDDDGLFDVFDDAETGEHDVHLTKDIRLPPEAEGQLPGRPGQGATSTVDERPDGDRPDGPDDGAAATTDDTADGATDDTADGAADDPVDNGLYDDLVTAGIGTETDSATDPSDDTESISDEPTDSTPPTGAAETDPAAGADTGAGPDEPADATNASEPAVETGVEEADEVAVEADPLASFEPEPIAEVVDPVLPSEPDLEPAPAPEPEPEPIEL